MEWPWRALIIRSTITEQIGSSQILTKTNLPMWEWAYNSYFQTQETVDIS